MNPQAKRRAFSAGLKSLVVVSLVCLAFASCSKREGALRTEGEPHMEFDSESYDFGTVFQMREYEGTFKLRNSGTADLVIDRVSATCGCTAALLSDKRVEPGGEAEIEVAFKSGMYSRAVRKTVRVLSNDPDSPQKRLYVKATVVPRLILEPKLLSFKDVHKRKGATQSISIKPSETEDIRSLKATFTSRELRAETERVSVVENDYRVNVSVRKGLPIGRISGWMKFYINGEAEPCAKIHVSAKIIGDITVLPTRLVFREKLGSEDESKIKPITLTNIASEPLEILSVESDVAGLNVKASPIEKGKSYTIVSRLAPDVQPGIMKGNITIRTNNADQSEITVPVHATVQ